MEDAAGRPESKRARGDTTEGEADTSRALSYVKSSRGRALTFEERLDILVVTANLRSGAVKLRQKEPIAVKVGRLFSRSVNTIRQVWQYFVERGAVFVALPPANRMNKVTRIPNSVDIEHSVRLFIQARSLMRIRTVAKDVLQHLIEIDALTVNMDDDDAMNAALRTVQRYLRCCGYKRGRRKGSTYRMSAENEAKRDYYVRMMMSEEADKHRTVYLDESYIHHNYSRHDDSIYDPTDPSITKSKHKGRRLCFIAAIIDKDRTRPDNEHTEELAAHLISETIDIFEGGKQTKDYHGMFNHDYFVNWMETLFESLRRRQLSNCRIVMDNAKYHKRLPDYVPKQSNRKSVMQAACDQFYITHTLDDTKAILWEKLSKHTADEVEPVIVSRAREEGREIVFTPPHYSDLQPIEYVWAIVKGDVGRQYTADTSFGQVHTRLQQAFKGIKASSIQGCIDKSRANLLDLSSHIMKHDDCSDSEASECLESESDSEID